MSSFEKVGIAPAKILFPNSRIESWATIACDQYTSDPSYWEDVKKNIGDDPSSLYLMMPEAWLGDESKRSHQDNISSVMKKYLDDNILTDIGEGFMFIHRTMSNGYQRRGLLCLLDLEKYDYAIGNKALCRATEGVVEERLPARIEIRKQALLEMPHVMVLVNDEKDILMSQLDILVRNRKPYYDANLMMNGGEIKGWFLNKESDFEIIENSLLSLLEKAGIEQDGMLYAVGDGNHSLAAAKRCGDRYAMVELVNVYDKAVDFHPIHRLLDKDGSVVDYIHGEQECKNLAKNKGLVAKIMPPYPKEKLFKDVIENGILPKKTFSIGNAVDKRYYLECHLLHE